MIYIFATPDVETARSGHRRAWGGIRSVGREGAACGIGLATPDVETVRSGHR